MRLVQRASMRPATCGKLGPPLVGRLSWAARALVTPPRFRAMDLRQLRSAAARRVDAIRQAAHSTGPPVPADALRVGHGLLHAVVLVLVHLRSRSARVRRWSAWLLGWDTRFRKAVALQQGGCHGVRGISATIPSDVRPRRRRFRPGARGSGGRVGAARRPAAASACSP
jgi:hypothetical protein